MFYLPVILDWMSATTTGFFSSPSQWVCRTKDANFLPRFSARRKCCCHADKISSKRSEVKRDTLFLLIEWPERTLLSFSLSSFLPFFLSFRLCFFHAFLSTTDGERDPKVAASPPPERDSSQEQNSDEDDDDIWASSSNHRLIVRSGA